MLENTWIDVIGGSLCQRIVPRDGFHVGGGGRDGSAGVGVQEDDVGFLSAGEGVESLAVRVQGSEDEEECEEYCLVWKHFFLKDDAGDTSCSHVSKMRIYGNNKKTMAHDMLNV